MLDTFDLPDTIVCCQRCLCAFSQRRPFQQKPILIDLKLAPFPLATATDYNNLCGPTTATNFTLILNFVVKVLKLHNTKLMYDKYVFADSSWKNRTAERATEKVGLCNIGSSEDLATHQSPGNRISRNHAQKPLHPQISSITLHNQFLILRTINTTTQYCHGNTIISSRKTPLNNQCKLQTLLIKQKVVQVRTTHSPRI